MAVDTTCKGANDETRAKIHPNKRRELNRKLGLVLADNGIPVFPSNGKIPLMSGWPKLDHEITPELRAELVAEWQAKHNNTTDEPPFVGCTTERATVLGMWREWPNATPSISLGPAGLYCIDCDRDENRDGPAKFEAWAESNGVDLSGCAVVRSQSGARHYYFSNPTGEPSRVPALFRDMFVQCKGIGNQTVAPGARRPDGRGYTFENGWTLARFVDAVKSGSLPPLPEQIRAVLASAHEGTSIDTRLEAETGREIAASEEQFEALIDPALGGFDIEALIAKDEQFAAAWRGDIPNGSDCLFHIIRGLRREYGEAFRKPHVLPLVAGAPVGLEWTDKKTAAGEFDERQLSRAWLKAEAEFADGGQKIVTGDAFGSTEGRSSWWADFDHYRGDIALGTMTFAESLTVRDNMVEAMQNEGCDAAAVARFRDAFEALTRLDAQPGADRVAVEKLKAKAHAAFMVEANVEKQADREQQKFEAQYPQPKRASSLNRNPPARQWIVPGWIPRGVVTMLSGDGGLGKSLLAQQLMYACATGSPWLGLETARVVSLGLFCEDDEDELSRRQTSIVRSMGLDPDALDDAHVWARWGLDNTLVHGGRNGCEIDMRHVKLLLRKVLETKAELLVLDTASDLFGGNEIVRTDVNVFIKGALNGIVKKSREAGHELSVLLLSHPSQAGRNNGTGESGSTAWNNSVRSRLYLSRPKAASKDGLTDEERNMRILKRMKANYGESGDEGLYMRWQAGAYMPCEKPQKQPRKAKAEAETDSAEGKPVEAETERPAEDNALVAEALRRSGALLKRAEIEAAVNESRRRDKLGEDRVTRAIGRLKNAGEVEQVGSGPATAYRLIVKAVERPDDEED